MRPGSATPAAVASPARAQAAPVKLVDSRLRRSSVLRFLQIGALYIRNAVSFALRAYRETTLQLPPWRAILEISRRDLHPSRCECLHDNLLHRKPARSGCLDDGPQGGFPDSKVQSRRFVRCFDL